MIYKHDKKEIFSSYQNQNQNKTMQTSLALVSSKKPTTIAHGDGEYNRGILNITIPSILVEGENAVVRQKMRFIMYVSIDASGSMGETATRRGQAPQTKMDFVHSTVKNMIEYIASQQDENPHAEFYIAVVSFDSRASCAITPCLVTKENKDQLIEVVTNIRPGGGTNFEKCFQEVARLMSVESEYVKPDATISDEFTERMHIFLTDGANNEGNTRVSHLVALLTPTFEIPQKPATQIMIGYGPDHDSAMLQNLCTHFPTSKQWFIDDVEKTGCIFGEILWSAMNAAYTDVVISSNVELYDFVTMSWKNEMRIDNLIYDSSRTFFVRVPWNVDAVVCDMVCFSTECAESTTHKTEKQFVYLPEPSEEVEVGGVPASTAAINEDVEKELWRLDTILTVNEALGFLQSRRLMTYSESMNEKTRLMEVVTAFQGKFLAYITAKGLTEDPFMVQLADDLFVCISGLMSVSVGERYVAARQASQIQQRSVTVNDITPLQSDILSSMPMDANVRPVAHGYGYACDVEVDDSCYDYPPPAPVRAQSNGGCVDNDTPVTPTSAATTNDAETEVVTEENEKIVSDFTPSSRGVGSRLRHLSRDAILGMRGNHRGHGGEVDWDNGCDDANDQVFSCHASPGCERIGRMLSAPRVNNKSTAPDRTPSAPF